jgi:hypothetical protein
MQRFLECLRLPGRERQAGIIYQVSLSIFSLLTLSVIANAMPPPPKWEALAIFANFIFMPRALPSGELASEARLRG